MSNEDIKKETFLASFWPALYKWIWGAIFTAFVSFVALILTYILNVDPTLRIVCFSIFGTLFVVGLIWCLMAYFWRESQHPPFENIYAGDEKTPRNPERMQVAVPKKLAAEKQETEKREIGEIQSELPLVVEREPVVPPPVPVKASLAIRYANSQPFVQDTDSSRIISVEVTNTGEVSLLSICLRIGQMEGTSTIGVVPFPGIEQSLPTKGAWGIEPGKARLFEVVSQSKVDKQRVTFIPRKTSIASDLTHFMALRFDLIAMNHLTQPSVATHKPFILYLDANQDLQMKQIT